MCSLASLSRLTIPQWAGRWPARESASVSGSLVPSPIAFALRRRLISLMGGPAASGVYPAKERVTDGARTRDLFSSATIRRCLFPGIAEHCRIGLEKQISSLEVAHCFWVLRARWFQGCCQESVD
jgi:hypothetical protein